MKSISVSVILKEQDEAAVITVIVAQLKKLIRLYQIPNIAPGADIELADWIYDNYKYEEFALVYSVLKNPPAIYDDSGNEKTNWRLTPDTVRAWMKSELEKAAVQRENEHQRLKSSRSFEVIEGLEEIYAQVKMSALNRHEISEDIKKMQRENWTRRYAPVDMEALRKRDETKH